MKLIFTFISNISVTSNSRKQQHTDSLEKQDYAVVSLGWEWGGPPGWHPPGGWHPKEKNLWANLQRIVEKRGRRGKKGVGWHPGGGDTRVKAIKSNSDSDSDEQKEVERFFRKKIKKWHPQLPPRLSPTLVTPLRLRSELTSGLNLVLSLVLI